MKSWFYYKVIKYRKAIMAAFGVMVVISALMYPKVYVDYDLLNYLPPESPSTVSLNVMKDEFGGNLPNVQIMIRNVGRKQASDYKRKIEAVDGVLEVQWIDSLLPVDMPLEVLPEGIKSSFYKDGNALFIITVDEDKQLQTIPELYDLVGEDNLVTGNAVTTVVATINTVKEIIIISIISVLFLLFVLVMATTSWAEPIIIMIGLGVAIVINAGTNLVFGKISFVTNSSGMILQLAVSIDYCVFLIHRFTECKEHAEPEEAMHEALMLSTSSILSSGLTTVIGFIALATMKFLIGADLGLALSKGVLISLITSLIFMPGFILSTYKLMERTRHRRLLPSFAKLGRFVGRVTVPLMIVFAIAIVPSFIGSTRNDFWYGGSHIYGSDTRVGSDMDKKVEVFGDRDNYVLMVPRGDRSEEHALVRDLEKLDGVSSVLSPVSIMGLGIPYEVMPESLAGTLSSEKYDRFVLSVAVPAESDRTFALIDEIETVAEKHYPGEYYLAGTGVSNYDLKKVVTGDIVKVNLIAILAVFIVLIFAMRNLFLPVLLVLTIETAIWINMSISLITGAHLFYIAYLIISSIQLGATVDYAILFTQRYRENRTVLGIAPKECIAETIKDTTASILASAVALTVMGFLLGFFSTQGIIAQIGLLLGRGTICSLIAVLFVLPGMLSTFDSLVLKTFRLPFIHKTGDL